MLNDLNENADDSSEKELYNYPSTPSTPGKSASFYSLANELFTFQNHGTREAFTIFIFPQGSLYFPARNHLLSHEESLTFLWGTIHFLWGTIHFLWGTIHFLWGTIHFPMIRTVYSLSHEEPFTFQKCGTIHFQWGTIHFLTRNHSLSCEEPFTFLWGTIHFPVRNHSLCHEEPFSFLWGTIHFATRNHSVSPEEPFTFSRGTIQFPVRNHSLSRARPFSFPCHVTYYNASHCWVN